MKVLKNETAKVLPLNGGSDILSELPKPSVYLNASAKKHFQNFGKTLIAAKQLKSIHIPALEILAENYAQWEWAVRSIKDKNKDKSDEGYIQRFKSGAENVSVYVTLKRDAEKQIMQSIKQFGLDPRSEKELKTDHNTGQLELFEGLMSSMQKTS